MKHRLISATATLALLAGSALAEDVRVYNWSDYIDEALLTKFTADTGLNLIYDVFDSNELLETKMLAGGSGYDVVVPSGTFLQRQISAGAFQKLDVAKLPNIANMWDVVTERTEQYDPDNAYSINYMWGTTGIGVNVGKVTELLGEDAPITSLDLVFKAENMVMRDTSTRRPQNGTHVVLALSTAKPKLENLHASMPLVQQVL